jgi:hypothetical protein
LTENSIIVDNDDGDSDLTDQSDRTSHQMTFNDPGVEGENTDGHAGDATHMSDGVASSDPDDAAKS